MAGDSFSKLRTSGAPSILDLTTTGPTEEERYSSPHQGSEFVTGLRRGGAGLTAQAYANEALRQELAGDPAWQQSLAEANEAQKVLQYNAPRVGSLADIHSVGDFVDYAGGAVGQGLPSMAPTLAAAIALRAPRVGAARGAEFMAPLGAGIAGYEQMRGEAALGQYNDPTLAATPVEERDKAATAVGAVGAALEPIVPLGVANAMFRGPGKGLMREIGKGALTEGATEATQDAAGQMGDRYLDPNREYDVMRTLDAAAAGALTGGAVSGGLTAPAAGVRYGLNKLADGLDTAGEGIQNWRAGRGGDAGGPIALDGGPDGGPDDGDSGGFLKRLGDVFTPDTQYLDMPLEELSIQDDGTFQALAPEAQQEVRRAAWHAHQLADNAEALKNPETVTTLLQAQQEGFRNPDTNRRIVTTNVGLAAGEKTVQAAAAVKDFVGESMEWLKNKTAPLIKGAQDLITKRNEQEPAEDSDLFARSLFPFLTPEARASEAVRKVLNPLGETLAAYANKVGELKAEDLRKLNSPKLRAALDFFGDQAEAALRNIMDVAQVDKKSAAIVERAIFSGLNAERDALDPNGTLAFYMAPQAWAQLQQLGPQKQREFGRLLDDMVANDGDKRFDTKLDVLAQQAFGGDKQRALKALDAFRKQRDEALAEFDAEEQTDEEGVDIGEARNSGINERDPHAERVGGVYRSGKEAGPSPSRPFFTGTVPSDVAQDSDDRELPFKGEDGNELWNAHQKALLTDSNAEVITMAEHVARTGESPAVAVGRIRGRLEREIHEDTLYETRHGEGTRNRLPRLRRELDAINKARSPEEALRAYHVVSTAGQHEAADDDQLSRFREGIDKAKQTRNEELSGARMATQISFEKDDGTRLVLSAESMIHHSRLKNAPEADRFADSLASVLARNDIRGIASGRTDSRGRYTPGEIDEQGRYKQGELSDYLVLLRDETGKRARLTWGDVRTGKKGVRGVRKEGDPTWEQIKEKGVDKPYEMRAKLPENPEKRADRIALDKGTRANLIKFLKSQFEGTLPESAKQLPILVKMVDPLERKFKELRAKLNDSDDMRLMLEFKSVASKRRVVMDYLANLLDRAYPLPDEERLHQLGNEFDDAAADEGRRAEAGDAMVAYMEERIEGLRERYRAVAGSGVLRRRVVSQAERAIRDLDAFVTSNYGRHYEEDTGVAIGKERRGVKQDAQYLADQIELRNDEERSDMRAIDPVRFDKYISTLYAEFDAQAERESPKRRAAAIEGQRLLAMFEMAPDSTVPIIERGKDGKAKVTGQRASQAIKESASAVLRAPVDINRRELAAAKQDLDNFDAARKKGTKAAREALAKQVEDRRAAYEANVDAYNKARTAAEAKLKQMKGATKLDEELIRGPVNELADQAARAHSDMVTAQKALDRLNSSDRMTLKEAAEVRAELQARVELKQRELDRSLKNTESITAMREAAAEVEDPGIERPRPLSTPVRGEERAESTTARGRKAAPQSATPEFDKLPAYTPGQKNMVYAGIGSRQTPPAVRSKMQQIAEWLRKQGYVLRSGGAEGADVAFGRGAGNRAEIFMASDATDRTRKIALEIHPNPQALSRKGGFALDLMARNTYQVFGASLDSPVDFVLTWTPDGAESTKERSFNTGGTGQAIDMASRKGIPVINMARDGWEDRLREVLGVERPRPLERNNITLGPRKNSFIGIKGAAAIGEAPPAALANTLDRPGPFSDDIDPAKEVFEATGWFIGPDGKARREIDPLPIARRAFKAVENTLMKAIADADENGGAMDVSRIHTELRIGDVLKGTQLEKMYPALKDVAFNLRWSDPENGSYMGAVSFKDGVPTLSVNILPALQEWAASSRAGDVEYLQGAMADDVSDQPLNMIAKTFLGTPDVSELIRRAGIEASRTFMHELQHLIQTEEGFAAGGTPATAIVAKYGDIAALAEALRNKDEAAGDEVLRQAFEKMAVAHGIAEGDPIAAMDIGMTIAHSLYRDLTGEAEAFNVERRLSLPPEKRRKVSPALLDQDTAFINSPSFASMLREARLRLAKRSSMSPKQGRPARQDAQALINAVKQRVGKAVQVYVDQTHGQLGSSGSYESVLNNGEVVGHIIRIATNAQDPLGVALHEAMHAFFAAIGKRPQERQLKADLLEVASSPQVMFQLRKLLDGHPAAIKQIETDKEERLAYMYQYWQNGQLKLTKRGNGIFNWIAGLIRSVTGALSKEEKVEQVLAAFDTGRFAGDSPVHAVLADLRAQTLGDKLDDVAGPVVDGLAAVFTNAGDRLRRTNIPALEELANEFATPPGHEGKNIPFLQRRAQVVGQYLNRYAKLVEGTTAAQRRVALENLQGMKAPSSDLERGLRALLDDLFKYVQEAGVGNLTKDEKGHETVEPIKFTEDYFPRVWDKDYIREHQAEFTKMVGAIIGTTEAYNVTQAILNSGGSIELAENEHDLGFNPFMNAVNKRKLNFITKANAAQFAKFQNSDITDVLTTYIQQAVHRAEYTRQFDVAGRRIGALLVRARQQGATEKELEMARKAVMAMEGTLGHDFNPRLKELQSAIMTAQNVILLPLALFSSLVDPIGVGLRSGSMVEAWNALKAGMSGIAKAMVRAPADEREEMVKLLGIIDDNNMLDAMGHTYNSMHMSARMKKINNVFFRINGMDVWNRRMRVAAFEAGRRFITRNVGNARYMEELGLRADDVLTMDDGVLAVTREEISGVLNKRYAKMPKALREKRVLTEATAIEKRVHAALFKFVDGAVLRPNGAQRPIWGSDPRFQLIFHLKQFTFSFHDTIIKRVANEFKNGNNMPVWMLMSYVPFMLVSDLLRGSLTGTINTSGSLLDMLAHSTARSGIMGTGVFAGDVAGDMAAGRLPGDSLLGPAYDHLKTLVGGVMGTNSAGEVLARSVPGGVLLR